MMMTKMKMMTLWMSNIHSDCYDFSKKMAFALDKNDYYIHLATGTHVAQICLYLLTESRHLPGKLIQTGPVTEGDKAQGSYAVIELDLSRYDMIAKRFAIQRDNDLAFLKSGIEMFFGISSYESSRQSRYSRWSLRHSTSQD